MASRGPLISETPGRASSTSRLGLSLARARSATTCSRRLRATTATTACRRYGCGTGWSNSARDSPQSSATYRARRCQSRKETEDSPAQQAVHVLVEALIARLPDDAEDRSDDERGRWLLAQLLNWHRREAKSFWWRHFYLREELTDEERRDESDALGELTFERDWRDPAPRARSTIYRFRFPPQEHRIRVGGQPYDPATGQVAATVFEVGEDHIDLRLGSGKPAPTPTSLIPDYVGQKPKPESLQRLAQWTIEHGIDAPGEYRAARDLLMRRAPRAGLPGGEALVGEDDVQEAAQRLVLALDETYLAIQGPPGSGKSTGRSADDRRPRGDWKARRRHREQPTR